MHITRGLLVTMLGICLSGCQTFREDVIPPTAGATAKAVDRYCMEMADLVVFRQEFVDRVNRLTEVGDLSALDCDSDGQPDFELED